MLRKRARGCGLATVFALALSAGMRGQQPTFRADTRLIVQTVSVVDAAGHAIEGLTSGDFVVTEDGMPQTVAFAEYQRLDTRRSTPAATPVQAATPTQSSTATPPAASLSSARGPNAAIAGSREGEVRYRDKRLLVLYFDLSSLPPADLQRAYVAARRYIDDMLAPSDLVALMSFDGGSVKVKIDFTADRALLLDALQHLVFGDDLDGDGIPDFGVDTGSAFGQDDAEFNILNTDRQLSALQTAAMLLRVLPDRKSLVYFSSGLRLNGVDNQAQLRATTNAALRASVAIFPVDARGLVATAPLGDASVRTTSGLEAFSGRGAERGGFGLQRSQDTLFALAADTGGRALIDYNDLSLGIQQAADAIESYYIVGYYSTQAAQDGKYRRVRVSLKDGRAGRLSYRQGYFADKAWGRFSAADKERQLEEALMLDNPVTDIPIALEVNYFQLNRAEYFVPVTMKLPGSELVLARKGGARRTVIDVIGEVKDDYGTTVQNVRDKVDIRVSDQTAAQLAARPIQYETGFTLLPGQYVIKVLARDDETGRMGTYQRTFTVPNLNRELERLPISSVVLSSQRVPMADAIFTVQKNAALAAHPLVFDGQKLLPSVTRVFSRARPLYAYVQAYERGADVATPLGVSLALYQGGALVVETPMAVADRGFDARSKAMPILASTSLADVPPGQYECQLTIVDPVGQKAAFWRAPIAVVP